jgi:1-acyl-sn-glycerol-3-phosphate acyltransferase
MTEKFPVIADSNTYTSPDIKGKYFLSPSLTYYFKLIKIIRRSNKFVSKGIYNGENWALSSFWILEALESVGIKHYFEGMDVLRKFDGPAVFIGNHMSTLETMILPSIINPVKRVVFIMKEELIKYPLFGPIGAARHPILVGRTNPRKDLIQAIETGSQRIKENRSIVVFPQKTRSNLLDCKSFNTLGEKIAKKNNVPIIPIAIISDAWGNSNIKIIKEFGKIDPQKEVRIAFGEPVYISGNGSEEHQQVLSFIKSKFIKWGREDSIIE